MTHYDQSDKKIYKERKHQGYIKEEANQIV